MFSGGDLSLVDPTMSFLDRYTPNLLGRWDIGTCFRGISTWCGLGKVCGSMRVTRTGVDHVQNQGNWNLRVYGQRHPFRTKPSGHSDR